MESESQASEALQHARIAYQEPSPTQLDRLHARRALMALSLQMQDPQIACRAPEATTARRSRLSACPAPLENSPTRGILRLAPLRAKTALLESMRLETQQPTNATIALPEKPLGVVRRPNAPTAPSTTSPPRPVRLFATVAQADKTQSSDLRVAALVQESLFLAGALNVLRESSPLSPPANPVSLELTVPEVLPTAAPRALLESSLPPTPPSVLSAAPSAPPARPASSQLRAPPPAWLAPRERTQPSVPPTDATLVRQGPSPRPKPTTAPHARPARMPLMAPRNAPLVLEENIPEAARKPALSAPKESSAVPRRTLAKTATLVNMPITWAWAAALTASRERSLRLAALKLAQIVKPGRYLR